ncbi:hypothetical protein Pfo_013055 [Paulownia fortunei]|nr:hypothetical protein Pfo_013055 [Paulownia fortunei]
MKKKMSSFKREVFLPSEITFEILSWLPVDSLLRFKCICKLWSSIIQDRKFIDMHMSRAIGGWVYKTTSENLSASPEEQKYVTCCRGLVLERQFGEKYRLRNPSTRKILDLPEPSEDVMCSVRMCYIPSTSELKLVYPYSKQGNVSGGCKILTVGTDATWRTLDLHFSCKLRNDRVETKILEEVYYIIRLPKSVGTCDPKIVCLELEKEQFSRIKIPHNFFLDWTRVGPVDWEGKLSLASVQQEELHVWVLENHREQKWAEKEIVIPLTFMKNNPARQHIIPCAFQDNGLLISSAHEELLLIDVLSGKIVDRIGAPEGEKFLYYNEPSLLHLKGMKPESENPN